MATQNAAEDGLLSRGNWYVSAVDSYDEIAVGNRHGTVGSGPNQAVKRLGFDRLVQQRKGPLCSRFTASKSDNHLGCVLTIGDDATAFEVLYSGREGIEAELGTDLEWDESNSTISK